MLREQRRRARDGGFRTAPATYRFATEDVARALCITPLHLFEHAKAIMLDCQARRNITHYFPIQLRLEKFNAQW